VGGIAYTASKAGANAAANEAEQAAPPEAEAPPAEAAPSADASMDELTKLKGLLDSGVLTQAEFDWALAFCERGGASLTQLDKAVSASVAEAAAVGGEAAELATRLRASWERLVAVTAGMFGSGDVEAALANSAVYLEAFGHIVVAWIWLEQFVAAERASGDFSSAFYNGKRQAARFFFRYELPRTAPQLDLLESLDRTTLEMVDDWF